MPTSKPRFLVTPGAQNGNENQCDAGSKSSFKSIEPKTINLYRSIDSLKEA
jgi:hypothetical protein